jgi:hypothetical protein
MTRRLLNLLTLLLGVAVVALWVRSYLYFEQVRYGNVPFAISLNSQQGVFMAEWTTQWPGLSYGLATQHKALRPVDRERGSGYFLRDCALRLGSFGCGRAVQPVRPVGNTASTIPTPFTIITVPHWAAALMATILATLQLLRWPRSRKSSAGHCPS